MQPSGRLRPFLAVLGGRYSGPVLSKVPVRKLHDPPLCPTLYGREGSRAGATSATEAVSASLASLSLRRRAMFFRTAIASSAACFIARSLSSRNRRSRFSFAAFASEELAMMCSAPQFTGRRARPDWQGRTSSTDFRKLDIPSSLRPLRTHRSKRSERPLYDRKHRCPCPQEGKLVSNCAPSW